MVGKIGHALQAGRLEGESRIGGFFRAMASSERRLVPLQAAQERALTDMGKDIRQATKAAVDALRADYRPIYQATYGEYQTTRSQLLARQQGEEVVISKAGKPGSARGQLHVHDNFDTPLPDELLAVFEGADASS